MSFWVAIVAIVFISSVSGVIKEAMNRDKPAGPRTDELESELAGQRAVIDQLRSDLNKLKEKVAEQEVFVDEAISQYRPRIERLRTADKGVSQPGARDAEGE